MGTVIDLAAVARALGNDRVRHGMRTATAYCPVCDYAKPMLSLQIKAGRLLACCHNGCDQREVFREIMRAAQIGGARRTQAAAPVETEADRMDRARQFRKWYAKWLRAAEVADHAIARRYIEGRGCVIPKPGGPLRALDDAYHWPTKTKWPALFAVISDNISLEPVGFQTTFLAVDGSGKAPVEPNKLSPSGLQFHKGVVRLTQHHNARHVPPWLGVAEGIESALSLAHAVPTVWACLTAGNMLALPVYDVERLEIAVDRDQAGERAAYSIARRYHAAGARARLVMPDKGDVNDLIQGGT